MEENVPVKIPKDMTHGTTIATTLSLLLLAGGGIRPFAWVMAFGIFTGTFSSIYIAAPVLLWIEKRWPGEDARGARALTTRSEEHTSELQSRFGISYAVFCLKKKN